MIGTAITAAGAFAGTNVDDLVLLGALFLAAERGPLRGRSVAVGQFAGVGALVLVSLLGAWGLSAVPDRWIGLLGLVPLALGVRGLIRAARGRAGPDEGTATAVVPAGAIGVAVLTVANGADNIAVYTPLFRTLDRGDLLLTVIVFAVLIGVWVAAGRVLGRRAAALAGIERVEPWLVPAVVAAIGAFILLEAGLPAPG